MLPIRVDNVQQKYVDVANVRITVKQSGWNGSQRHVTIRAYTGQGNSLMMGPEIPINIPASTLDDETLLQMLGGIFTSIA
jgi:hypothetical protein